MTEEQIERLIQLRIALKTTDYKIIKAYEYELAGLETPYDISELHTERETIREKIRQR
ncbi:MAG TPA: hypothetical protein VFC76_02600 [Oscillospiraceae bacterium]|nr:hypothetical protein [Oscillospiraceae bacterium]